MEERTAVCLQHGLEYYTSTTLLILVTVIRHDVHADSSKRIWGKIPIRCLYDNDKRMKAISLTHAISQNEWKKVRKRV
jgi:hypothetical protein